MSQFSFHYVCIITILCPNLFHHTFSTFLLIFKHYHQLFQKSCLAFLFCFETGTHSVAQSGFKFMISFFWYQGLNSGPCVCQTGTAPLCYLPDTDCMIFSPQPPECWGYSHGSSFLAFAFFFFFFLFSLFRQCLPLPLQPRVALNSQRSSCLCLMCAGITGVHLHSCLAHALYIVITLHS